MNLTLVSTHILQIIPILATSEKGVCDEIFNGFNICKPDLERKLFSSINGGY